MGLRSILGKVAPFLGGLIGGPLGKIATGVIGQVLMPRNPNPSEEELELALASASPEQLTEIKRIDADYKVNMAQISLEEQKVEKLDKDSARRRHMTMKDSMPAILASSVTIGFFAILFIVFFDEIDPGNARIFDMMLGSLGTAWITMISYYFGGNLKHNSKSSSK